MKCYKQEIIQIIDLVQLEYLEHITRQSYVVKNQTGEKDSAKFLFLAKP